MSGDGDDDQRKRLDDATEQLRRATVAKQGLARELAALNARISVLTDALVAADILKPGHLKLMEAEAADAARRELVGKVQLRVVYGDEEMPEAIDCDARLHLCHGRCCTMEVTLSEKDLDAGLAWEIEEPYQMRRSKDGYCTYIDRSDGRCTVYDKRPRDCRVYTCKNDPRIWLDFESRIPAPPPSSFRPLRFKRPQK
jgi:Fe-S-cluster containining protein